MRIAIVNHEPQTAESLRQTIASVPVYDIAWIAYNGRDAIEKCLKDRPDLILMDLVLPGADGVQTIGAIMKQSPCAILVVTASVAENAGSVFEAMGCGALDAVRTPFIDHQGKFSGADDLLKKIAMIGRLRGINEKPPKSNAGYHKSPSPILPPLVAIGSSTGGPKALAAILSSLPAPIDAAIVIVQHVDEQFASGLSNWLNDQTRITVEMAREGMAPASNTALVAGTNDHLILGPDLVLHYTEEPRKYPYRPSVDTFFMSLEKNWPRKGLAVLLTGMGKDGARGLYDLRKSGWHTIAQDERSSAVYGMPAAAAEMNAATEILPLEDIAEAIQKRLKQLLSNRL